MLPTLNLTGDVVLSEYISHRLGKVGPGDVVLIQSPENPRKMITKRVVGMEGESIVYLVDPSRSDRSRTVVVMFYNNVVVCCGFCRVVELF